MAIGAKRIETRSWAVVTHRGPLAIHAAKTFPVDAREEMDDEPFLSALGQAGYHHAEQLPRGAIVAVCELVDCIRFTRSNRYRLADGTIIDLSVQELSFGDFTTGRYGFVLRDIRPLRTPIPCNGALGLWDVPAEVLRALRSADFGAPAVPEPAVVKQATLL